MSLRAGRQADEAIPPPWPGRRLLRMGVHKHPRSQRQTLMSLRGGRQADEAIPPSPGRGGDCFATLAKTDFRRGGDCFALLAMTFLPPGRRLLRMGVHKHPRSQRQPLMSLRGGRQADEAIPPLAWPGRRLLRYARKDIKDLYYPFYGPTRRTLWTTNITSIS